MATQADRVAIVTGRARGFGRACAHVLSQRGCAMVLIDVLYAAAKVGIIGTTRSLAKELGPDMLVNCVCLGPIKTEIS